MRRRSSAASTPLSGPTVASRVLQAADLLRQARRIEAMIIAQVSSAGA